MNCSRVVASEQACRHDAGNPVQVLSIADFKAQLDEQIATGTFAKVAARAA